MPAIQVGRRTTFCVVCALTQLLIELRIYYTNSEQILFDIHSDPKSQTDIRLILELAIKHRATLGSTLVYPTPEQQLIMRRTRILPKALFFRINSSKEFRVLNYESVLSVRQAMIIIIIMWKTYEIFNLQENINFKHILLYFGE